MTAGSRRAAGCSSTAVAVATSSNVLADAQPATGSTSLTRGVPSVAVASASTTTSMPLASLSTRPELFSTPPRTMAPLGWEHTMTRGGARRVTGVANQTMGPCSGGRPRLRFFGRRFFGDGAGPAAATRSASAATATLYSAISAAAALSASSSAVSGAMAVDGAAAIPGASGAGGGAAIMAGAQRSPAAEARGHKKVHHWSNLPSTDRCLLSRYLAATAAFAGAASAAVSFLEHRSGRCFLSSAPSLSRQTAVTRSTRRSSASVTVKS